MICWKHACCLQKKFNRLWWHLWKSHNVYLILTIMEDTSLAAKGALAHRLQRRTACKIQNGRQGAPTWERGSGKVSTPRILGVLSNFRQISFLIQALPLWEKVVTEKKWKKKRIVKIAVHDRRGSQPPERRPTGAPTARANINSPNNSCQIIQPVADIFRPKGWFCQMK